MAGRGERRLNRLALQGPRRHDEPPFHDYHYRWSERMKRWRQNRDRLERIKFRRQQIESLASEGFTYVPEITRLAQSDTSR